MHVPVSVTGATDRRVDVGLTGLLVVQALTLFVAIPLGGSGPFGHFLLDACHLAFAAICVAVLTRDRRVRATLLLALVLLVGGPGLSQRLGHDLRVGAAVQHEMVAMAAFAFNGAVTALTARHVFAPGRVTVHRVRGAVLLYLNVAALFAIAYGALAMFVEGSFSVPGGAADALSRHGGTAAFSYFSLATITTTGYGDMVPVHPVARSLANLEAVFGQLFPATLLSRLVSLHLAHERDHRQKNAGDA